MPKIKQPLFRDIFRDIQMSNVESFHAVFDIATSTNCSVIPEIICCEVLTKVYILE